MFDWLIMLEAISLSVMGGVGYILLKHLKQDIVDLQPIRYLALGVIAGILAFATLGEPSAETAWMFMTAGAGAPAFIKEILVPWWKA